MTGLIYVVIIALWAAVLIPIWLRRHDHISEVRSTARFSSAMKSLSGRGQVQYAADGYDIDPVYSSPSPQYDRDGRPSRDFTEARMTRGSETRPAEGVLDQEYERELVRQQAATRRAIVLGVLTVLLLAVLILAAVGVMPKWAPILAALPVLAFVVATAMTASSRSSVGQGRERREAPRRRTRMEAAPAPVAQHEDDDWETWNAWDDDDAWDAVPTTLPTYVDAPRASAVPRPIDRSRPGEWTGEAMVETARAMRSRPVSEPLSPASSISASDETAEIPAVRDHYSDRRAANQ